MRKLADFFKENYNNISIAEKKRLLRKSLLAQRKTLASQTKQEDWGPNQFIKALEVLNLTKTLSTDLEKNKFRIACYFPINDELNLIKNKNEHWLFPAIGENRELLWFEFGDGKTGYFKNKYNILEREKKYCFSYTLEMPHLLCFTPGLAASQTGYRLGYGGGYYDCFLKQMKENITSILCLPSEDFIFDQLPIEGHDQKINTIIF